MISVLRAVVISAIFSAVAVLLHSWREPYGLFLALATVIVMMQVVRSGSTDRFSPLAAALTWIVIAWIGSNARNGEEILIEGDTIGSSFLIGATSFLALMLISRRK
jgi:hypothetical protein